MAGEGSNMRYPILVLALVLLASSNLYPQTIQDRLRALEAQVGQLQKEIEELKRETATTQAAPEPVSTPESPTKATKREFSEQIHVPDLGGDEREHKLEGKPEIFLQTRFSRNLLRSADPRENDQNFQLTRIEVRWSGRVSAKVGAGLEMQFHPAPAGSPDEIVNDAFLEFYPKNGITLRAGQFVKPFGFDVQQSSSEREYPERAMFEGYFFPGERDRGVMFRWDTSRDQHPALRNTSISAALLNGNRFFSDTDTRLNTVLRVRRTFPDIGFA